MSGDYTYYMTLDDYQNGTAKTAIYPREGVGGIVYCTLGLTGEAGEIANKVKKILRDEGGQLTEEKRCQLVDELGDVMWYVSQLATELGTRLEDVAHRNLDKLAARKEKGTLSGSGDKR